MIWGRKDLLRCGHGEIVETSRIRTAFLELRCAVIEGGKTIELQVCTLRFLK
jgi:hypothetical protein